MSGVIVILALAAGVVLWVIGIYNRLVRMSNLRNEAWSGIDVQLKRRSDLVPNLIETVKAYASHEKDVFTKVTEARTAAVQARTVAERAQSETLLGGALRSLFAVAENYPTLQANTTFLQLQEQLARTRIQPAHAQHGRVADQFEDVVDDHVGRRKLAGRSAQHRARGLSS